MKLKTDFGVRALLATIALVGYEGLLLVLICILWRTSLLDVQTSVTIGATAQAPAMLALGFYFGTRSGQGPTNGQNSTPPAPPTP